MSANLQKMIEAETRLASTGILPEADVPGTELYQSRVIRADYQKAEAFVLNANEQVEPLHLLRTYLSRGNLARASQILEQLQATAESEELMTELLLESSRLASSEGRWIDCEFLSRAALEANPVGISQLTLRQVHATSLIELGRLGEAQREIEQALILAKLYPHGNLSIYVSATNARYLVRSGMLSAAEMALEMIWKKLRGPSLNIDVCIVLLRIELELRRARKQESAHLALAIWILCLRNGDKLYEALAAKELEIHEALHSSWRSIFLAVNEFARARLLPEPIAKIDGLDVEPTVANAVRHVLLERQGILIDVESLTVSRIKPSDQFWSIFRTLSAKPISRVDFFAHIWGSQKFNAALHDDVIRRAIYRLRRAFPVELIVNQGDLLMPTAWIVCK